MTAQPTARRPRRALREATRRAAGAGTTPAHWEADVVLADGGVVHLRPPARTTPTAILAMHGG